MHAVQTMLGTRWLWLQHDDVRVLRVGVWAIWIMIRQGCVTQTSETLYIWPTHFMFMNLIIHSYIIQLPKMQNVISMYMLKIGTNWCVENKDPFVGLSRLKPDPLVNIWHIPVSLLKGRTPPPPLTHTHNTWGSDCSYIVCWEPEGRYCRFKDRSVENQKGAITVQQCMAIAPFWFSTEHLWSAITPFWLFNWRYANQFR